MIEPSLWMRSMVLAVLLSVVGAHAQPITAESRDATEEEEALIRQGYIFYPPLRVRTDEQLQQIAREAAQKKAAQEAARLLAAQQAAELKARQETEEQARKQAEQEAQEQAEKLARINQQAQIEAEEAARRLAARQAQRLKQAQTTAPNQQVADNAKQAPPVDPGKQSAYGAAVVETVRNLQQGKWVHNDDQHNVSLSKDSFFFQRFGDQGLKYSLGIEAIGKGGKASLNFDVGVVRQPFSYGAYVGVKDKAMDVGVNAVWSQAPFAYGFAIGQQRGEEVYPYFSGPENTKVSNHNYLLDFAYAMDLGLIKNMGVSYWRSTGKQREALSPVLIDVESDLYIDTYLDHRKLSPGTLYGYSFRAQGTLPFNSSYRLNLGQESIAYQYWSGASDKRSKSYLDIDLKHFLNERSAIGLGYKKGVAEDGKYFDYINGNWRVRLDNKKSINQTDDVGVGIYYEQNFGSTAKANINVNGSVSAQSIDVSKKPNQFLDGFLVKVDPTAVKLISTMPKGEIRWQGSMHLGSFNDLMEPNRDGILVQLPIVNTNGRSVSVDLIGGQLPSGLVLSRAGILSGNADSVSANTTYSFDVRATSEGASSVEFRGISIGINAPNSIAWVSNGLILTLNESISPTRSNVQYQIVANSANGDPVTFDAALASGSLPPGLVIDQNGLITGTTPSVLNDAEFIFKVKGYSFDSSESISPEMKIIVKKPNQINWISAGVLGSYSNCSRNQVSLNLNAVSTAGESVSYTLNSGALPDGLSLSSDGLISGNMSPSNSIHQYNFTVMASAPNASNLVSSNLTINFNPDGVYYNSVNGHFYRHVNASGKTWQQVKQEAESTTCSGISGYLATITTNQELNFIDSVVYPGTKPDNIFIGASDSASQGNWRWVTGPEGLINNGLGALFYSGGSSGVAVNGYIAPWLDYSELDKQPNYDYAFIYSSFTAKFNPWNGSLGTPGSGGGTGYLVEYGN